jgi:hypothetical protein
MPQTVRWLPSTGPNIVSYAVLYSDTGTAGPFLPLATVQHVIPGPNYDTSFFYVDPATQPARWYRLRSTDLNGYTYDDVAVPPFQAGNVPEDAPIAHVFPIDHNTGGVNALQYVNPDGDGIEGAYIRIYKKPDYDARLFSKVVGLTKTTATGAWASPIMVEPGHTFVVQFHLPDRWGPDIVEITP